MITLPWPSSELSPNARGHWAIKARAVKAARRDGFYAAKAANAPALTAPIAVQITFHPERAYHYDVDNLQARIKSHLDGIADALGINDRHFRPVSTIGAPRKPGCVVVTLQSIEEN